MMMICMVIRNNFESKDDLHDFSFINILERSYKNFQPNLIPLFFLISLFFFDIH